MRTSLALATTLSLACAIPRAAELSPIPISVSSNNRSSVEVYLWCGDRDAQWLGSVPAKETGLFDLPASHALCARGLNFFLVHRDQGRGYWVGPLRPQAGSGIHLTIEKYAGLSFARVNNLR